MTAPVPPTAGPISGAVADPYRMPAWLHVVLVLLHVVAIAAAIVVGNATYDRWSAPDDPAEVAPLP